MSMPCHVTQDLTSYWSSSAAGSSSYEAEEVPEEEEVKLSQSESDYVPSKQSQQYYEEEEEEEVFDCLIFYIVDGIGQTSKLLPHTFSELGNKRTQLQGIPGGSHEHTLPTCGPSLITP